MPPGEGEKVDLTALELQAIVYVKGAMSDSGAHVPFKRGHDFAIFALPSIDAAVEVARGAASSGASAGVGIGDVLVEGTDRFGTPVVIAARLAGVAGAGEVLCDPLVASIAPHLGFDEGGVHELKGIGAPMAAVRPMETAP